jgi:excisionase family DNA binding protein
MVIPVEGVTLLGLQCSDSLVHSRMVTETSVRSRMPTETTTGRAGPLAPDPNREVLRPQDLAAFLGCGSTTSYALIADGSIKSFRVRSRLQVHRADAEAYVQEQRRKGAGA